MADVFLHIGLPKTGTTTVQAALDRNVDRLAAAGTLLPGGRTHAHRLASYDLLGQRIAGDTDAVVAGSLTRLLDEIAAYAGRRVVVSEEDLGLARPRQVRRIVSALEGHRVYVVVTVRDLARTIVSAWQQSVAMGGTTPWQEFVDSVRDPELGTPSVAAGFGLRHSLPGVLESWGAVVPADRIRLVTVPPPGAPHPLLLERFCAAVDLEPHVLPDVELRNESLGAAELEVLRRLNGRIRGELPKRQYRHVVEFGLRPRWNTPDSRRLVLPGSEYGWVHERSLALVESLRTSGHPVYGDLADLLPAPPADGRRLDDVTEPELLAASETGLAALAVAEGRLFGRYRRTFFARVGRWPSPAEVVGSSARASAFKVRKGALAAADRSRVLRWATRAYLRRR